MFEPASRYFISRHLRLHYVDWGNEQAPPLILLHGGLDHCRSWDWVAQKLRDRWHVIAPDLRGHGDSAWSPDSDYSAATFLYDLTQFVHQHRLAPVTLVAHSLGGNICLRYTGLYPENVRKLVAIEGLGPSPKLMAERDATPVNQRMRRWFDEQRAIAGRKPRHYDTVEEAVARMQSANKNLSIEQARHLTIHGLGRNEDGSYSWKYDNTARSRSPVDLTTDEQHELWGRITCPTLLIYGAESWASNPATDGRAAYFRNAKVSLYERAAHWVHHDRLDRFVQELQEFL